MEQDPLIKNLVDWLELFILDLCDVECPNCQKMLSYPTSEDIENWLKGEK